MTIQTEHDPPAVLSPRTQAGRLPGRASARTGNPSMTSSLATAGPDQSRGLGEEGLCRAVHGASAFAQRRNQAFSRPKGHCPTEKWQFGLGNWIEIDSNPNSVICRNEAGSLRGHPSGA